MTSSEERWVAAFGYEGVYEVSDLGRVRSVTRQVRTKDGRTWTAKGRVLSPAIDKAGYPFVSLKVAGKQRTHRVHRLVLMSFVGPPPEGMECLHRDHNRANPGLVNLRWGTHAENMQAAKDRGSFHKTHCKRGHPLEGENLERFARTCRTCRRARQRDPVTMDLSELSA